MSWPTLPELERAAEQDVQALVEVFFRALDDLVAKPGRPASRPQPVALQQIIAHLLSTDPGSVVVARERGEVVAFGMLHVRGAQGFLSFLFVLPEHQAHGLGRAVLQRCLEAAGGPKRMATCTASDQPVSTGLYASLGLAPRLPIYVLRGAPHVGALPGLPEGCRMRLIQPGAGDRLDERLLGYRRPRDHAFWEASRQGWQLEDRGGRVVGYGYAQESGRIGPVAAADADHLPAILGHLARAVRPVDGWQVLVPGPASSTLRALLAGGLRLDGVPGVYCADHTGAAFDRYLPMSFALL